MSEDNEDRLIQIESTVAHLEDLVEKLNQVVTEQSMTIGRLKKESLQVSEMLANSEMEEIRKNCKPPPHWGKG